MILAPSILFENDDFMVINKPAGWLSVPARDPKPSDLVLSHWAREHSGNQTAFVVHRLDRFTSGTIVFAKTEAAQKTGHEWFESKSVKKTYWFLAAPPPSRPAIQIKTPLDGKPSQTLFEVLEKTPQFFLAKATPLTGRFHQIREHAKEAGFPILGDARAKGILKLKIQNQEVTVPRVCLHARALETPLGKIEAPFPDDLAQLWRSIQNDKE